MLKTTELFDKLALNKNDGSKLAFNRNNNTKPASKKNNSNNEIDGFDISRNSMKHIKKSGKLFKSRKSKSEKTSKSQKSKSKKCLSLKIWLNQEKS